MFSKEKSKKRGEGVGGFSDMPAAPILPSKNSHIYSAKCSTSSITKSGNNQVSLCCKKLGYRDSSPDPLCLSVIDNCEDLKPQTLTKIQDTSQLISHTILDPVHDSGDIMYSVDQLI